MSGRVFRDIRIHTDNSESGPPSANLAHSLDPIATSEALSPIALPVMNSLNGTADPPSRTRTPNGTTIRSVPAEPLQLETSTSTPNITIDEWRRGQGKADSNGMPASKSYGNITSQPPLSWQNNLPVSNGLVRSISSEFGPTVGFSNGNPNKSNPDNPEESSSHTIGVITPTNGTQWSAAIGRAGQGKSGRVIERLMGENDALKRDIKVERLRAEESNQQVKMIETKMEGLSAGLERELQEASFNTLQLKRRDRQLAEARIEVDYERQRAVDAEQKEKAWKDQLTDVQEKSMREISQAKERVIHVEANYTTVRSHWPGEKAKLDKGVLVLRKDIAELVAERQKDDERIRMLRSLGEQQAEQITELERQNQAIAEAFERYKEEQERGLLDIKSRAREQEEENDRLLEESRKTLGELKWALGVKRNVRGAQ